MFGDSVQRQGYDKQLFTKTYTT